MCRTIARQIRLVRLSGALVCALLSMVHAAAAQTTRFTYQVRVADANLLPDGTYPMRFTLFEDETSTTQVGPTLTFDSAGSNPKALDVINGVLTVQLDFGADAFSGKDRYLNIEVKYPIDPDFVTISPRRQLTSPYAIRSLNATVAEKAKLADQATLADIATNAQRLGGVDASKYLQIDDSRLADPRLTVGVPGNLNVAGTLSKGAGSFKIDHPLDPENKFLYHSFVESPDMMNVYNGNVTTDGHGNASVSLPNYFEALNRDFRYQLTVIGQFAQAIVSQEIEGNAFKIRTDKPNVKVSWQVTGIRRDKFAEDNRIQVEVEKTRAEKGKCLYAPLCAGAAAN